MTDDFKSQLYNEYFDKVYRLIMGKILNSEQAEDIAQDVFVKVFQNLDSFDESKASISTWIFRIANNTLIDYYRTRKVHAELPEDLPEDSYIEEDILNEELLDELADALATLPERERSLIILHYYQYLSLKEVALKMGMSYSNTKLVHNKAIELLKTRMKKFA